MPTGEKEKGPENPDAHLKGQLRKLMKQYHSDMGGVTGKQAEVIMKILAACRDASTSAEYGDPKHPTKWEGTWDQWRGRNAFSDEFITLVRASVDGKGNKTTEYSERAVRVPESPREFINTLQMFVDTGELPPETAQDRQARERADAAATRRQRGPSYADPSATYGARDRQQQEKGPRGDYGAWEQQQQEEARRRAQEEAQRRQEEEQSTWRKWQQERAERAQRRQEEAARQAQEDAARRTAEDAERRFKEQAEQRARERAERVQRAKEEAQRRAQEEARAKAAEEAARKAQEEAVQREREAREAAEREAEWPENLFPRRIAEAQTLDDFRGIVQDMDNALENQSSLDLDHAFLGEVYADLRFSVIPKRVGELFRTEIANAQKPEALRKIFRDIVQDGFFRERGHREMLSADGEALLSGVYTHAGLYFKGVIQGAKFRSELADIGKDIERFFGGSLKDAEVLRPTVIRRRLSQIERSKLSPDQIKRYELGENAAFRGLLSEADKEEILANRNIAFFGPAQEDIRQVVAGLAAEIEQQKVRLRPLAQAA